MKPNIKTEYHQLPADRQRWFAETYGSVVATEDNTGYPVAMDQSIGLKPEATSNHDPITQREHFLAGHTSLGRAGIEAQATQEALDEAIKQWGTDNINEVRSMIQNNFAHDESEPQEASESRTLLNDPLLLEHREEIILASIDAAKRVANTTLRMKIARLLADGKPLSNKVIVAMISKDSCIAPYATSLSPAFTYDKMYVDAMINNGSHIALMRDAQWLITQDLQYAVDKIVRDKGIAVIEGYIENLPNDIKLSEEALVDLAANSPPVMSQLLAKGKFPEARSSLAAMTALCDVGYMSEAVLYMSDELVRTIGVVGVFTMTKGMVSVRAINKLEGLGLLDTDENLQLLIEYSSKSQLRDYSPQFSRRIQSYIFHDFVSRSEGTDWTRSIGHFTKLNEDDYVFLLDSMDAIRETSQTFKIRMLFSETQGDAIKQRFADEVEPWLNEVEREAVTRRARNDSRAHQRKIEDRYVEAGNFQLGAYEGTEPLTSEQIARALEYGHSVRKAGRLEDIATDQSRTNTIECIDTTTLMTSYDLGASTPKEDRVTYTEHIALEKLLLYLREGEKIGRDDGFYRDMIDNLTYIGKKEYDEAVEGIAVYWKWFLDKDSENQLYADSSVTAHQGSVKSDLYMLDSILEHFTDEEMEKYKGRLIISDTDLLQQDPTKVKVVLLDDWTISGAQLREGYRHFVNKNRHLATCVEVQLITATKSRIARGIEQMKYSVKNSPVGEANVPIVTRAYYVAHDASIEDESSKNTHITGSHSSVDFGFGSTIWRMNDKLNGVLPPAVNIIRKYRQKEYVTQHINRLKKVYNMNEGEQE